MRTIHRSAAVLAGLLVALASPTLAQDWDESADGDLSDDRFNPTPILLNAGSATTVRASQQGNALGRDIDFFTITVPDGWRLDELFVDAYSAAAGNQAFLGLAAGATMPVDPGAPNPALLLGGIVYGAQSVNQDVLPAIGTLNGAIGFVPPLPPGEYTIWLNQTGGASTVELRFITQLNDLGTNYCPSVNANSTGLPGLLEGVGTASIAANNFRLRASQLPANAFGFALASLNQGFTPNPGGSMGNVCLGSGIGRYVDQILSSGASGEIVTVVDLTAIPQPTGFVSVVPFQTWNFQLWHRDSVGGASTSNFTDALAVTFQ